MNFESSLRKLDLLAKQLENSETTLEESLTIFEEGINITTEAQKVLAQSEQRVLSLLDEKGKATKKIFFIDKGGE